MTRCASILSRHITWQAANLSKKKRTELGIPEKSDFL